MGKNRKISVYNKIMIKNQKKRKYGNQRNTYINMALKRGVGKKVTTC